MGEVFIIMCHMGLISRIERNLYTSPKRQFKKDQRGMEGWFTTKNIRKVKGLEQTVPKNDTQLEKKYMRRFSTSRENIGKPQSHVTSYPVGFP